MILLGTYQIRGSWHLKPSEINEKLDEYAHREFNDGVRQREWQGYICVRQTNTQHHDYYNVYYYSGQPTVSYNKLYKISNGKLIEL